MTRLGFASSIAAVLGCAVGALSGCSGDDDGGDTGDGSNDPGAIVSLRLESTVGVILEDLPADLREDAAAQTLALPDEFWIQRAQKQIDHTWMRLAFRRLFGLLEGKVRSQLPLPPREQWVIELNPSGPSRQTFDDHDVVAVGYTFTSTILTDPASVELAERALVPIGGVWDEHFVFPLDPEMVFQRTGYACMHEINGIPFEFLDGENAYYFYDFECIGTQFPEINCHLTTGTTDLDCDEALRAYVGRVDTSLHFERLPWDQAVADSVRNAEAEVGVDLEARVEGLQNNRLAYRYIPEGDCTIEEGCVDAPGWRRVILFDASLVNRGDIPLHMGDPDDLAEHNMFEYSACHNHKHFRFYGDFEVTDGSVIAQGDKKAFCLQSTRRYNNNEKSPLATPYDKCEYQGIGAGWGDDYGAGLDCQWVDVTDVDFTGGDVDADLSFVSNRSQFLCEGEPVLDDAGNFTFEPTEYMTADGKTIDRVVCDFRDGWDSNNTASTPITIPTKGGYVTAPCTHGQLGPLRDCGFTEVAAQLACTPGQSVSLTCSVADTGAPQLLRLCEASEVLGTGIACNQRHALGGGVVGATPLDLTVTCPASRDASEPGGSIALYTSPALDALDAQAVTCVAN